MAHAAPWPENTRSDRSFANRSGSEQVSDAVRFGSGVERYEAEVVDVQPPTRPQYPGQFRHRPGRVRLTDAGRALHARIAASYDAQFHRWAAVLSDAESRALMVGLPALIGVVRESDDARGRPV
jgi:hypothetical protein